HRGPHARSPGAAVRWSRSGAVPARAQLSQRVFDGSVARADRHRHSPRSGANRWMLAPDRYRTGPRAGAPAGRIFEGRGRRRVILGVVVMSGVAGVGACNKPTADDCRTAIANMQRLLGTDGASRDANNEAEVRRCKGGSSRDAVACAAKATTLDELKACEFMA